MRVHWDSVKAARNRVKHGVCFSDAELVLSDPLAITLEDQTAAGERRHVSIGQDTEGRVLVLVYVYRHNLEIRLISARPATRRERKDYEKGI